MDPSEALGWTLFDIPGPEDVTETLVATGLKHVQAGRYEEAVHVFEQVVESRPDNPYHRVNLASAYQDLLSSGRIKDVDRAETITERACDHLLQAVRLNPDFAPAYRSLGFLYRGMEAPWRAREMWSFYLEMEPEGAFVTEVTDALEELDRIQNLHRMCEEASYLVNHGEAERGLQMLREVVEAESGWYEAWFWMGLACRELEMLDAGIEAFGRAVELDSESPFAYHELAALLARKGEREAAEGFWRRALEIDPEEPWILSSLGLLLWRDERRTEAEDIFTRARDVDPANRRLWLHLRALRAGDLPPPHDL